MFAQIFLGTEHSKKNKKQKTLNGISPWAKWTTI